MKLARFTSRKFLLSVAAVATALANHNVPAAIAAAIVYVAAEAHVDSKSVVSVVQHVVTDETTPPAAP